MPIITILLTAVVFFIPAVTCSLPVAQEPTAMETSAATATPAHMAALEEFTCSNIACNYLPFVINDGHDSTPTATPTPTKPPTPTPTPDPYP